MYLLSLNLTWLHCTLKANYLTSSFMLSDRALSHVEY